MSHKISIIGFGNQGRAWAENLRDSGWNVTILTRPESRNRNAIVKAGYSVHPITDGLPQAQIIALLTPDDAVPGFVREHSSSFRPGQSLVFAHGFALHFKTAPWPKEVDRILVAPKGIGTAVRGEFVRGAGVPAVLAVDHDASGHAWETAEAVAEGIGATRAGIYRATAREEVEADLFSEQALLCGGIPALISETYGALVKSGVRKELAYLECVHELKFFVDLIQEKGIHDTLMFASPTARFGGLLGGKRLISPSVRDELKSMLADVQSGAFRERLETEADSGYEAMSREMEDLRTSDLETIGRQVRNRMEKSK